MEHHLHPNSTSELRLSVTPASAGWHYLSFSARAFLSGDTHTHLTQNTEVAIVPLSGEGRVTVGDQSFTLERENVFAGKPDVLYAPPKHEIRLEAKSNFEFSLGGAPAEGKYPVRLFKQDEMKSEMRGGGTALRPVNHILAAPLPAE
jgi:5-deoxy-glucuronate isomerase